MYISYILMSMTAVVGTLGDYSQKPLVYPPDGPSNIEEFREKYPYDPGNVDDGRKVVTIGPSEDDLDDVSGAFYSGLQDANNGGTLYLPADQTFVIGKPLDLTFLDDVQVRLDGKILFTNDTAYWEENAYDYPLQSSRMFWKWGGNDIRIYGNGTIDGNGQQWWNEINPDEDEVGIRPILFYAQNVTNFTMEGIHLKDSPMWNQLFVTSKGIKLYNLVVDAVTKDPTVAPKNTDFFDSVNVDTLDVKNIWVNIGDDCFSPKTNTSNVHVDTMYCNGTHGQSMGSIGQYAGEKSIIENVLMENVWLMNGANGARMKSWAGEGIGYGYINNITYRNFWLGNSDLASQIDSCYFDIDASTCEEYPSQVNVTNIRVENFTGSVNGRYGQNTASLTCSTNPDAICENIEFVNWNITSDCGGPAIVICDGIKGGIGIPCYESDSEEATAALAATC